MDGDFLKFVGGVAILIILIGWGVNELARASCYAETAGMKATVDYGFLSDCRVSTPDGRMVPLSVYREVKQQPE